MFEFDTGVSSNWQEEIPYTTTTPEQDAEIQFRKVLIKNERSCSPMDSSLPFFRVASMIVERIRVFWSSGSMSRMLWTSGNINFFSNMDFSTSACLSLISIDALVVMGTNIYGKNQLYLSFSYRTARMSWDWYGTWSWPWDLFHWPSRWRFSIADRKDCHIFLPFYLNLSIPVAP